MSKKGNNRIDQSKKKASDSQLGADVAADQLPPSILGLIDENTVSLSGASKFFRKRAETAALLRDFVEALPNFSYRLKNEFDRFFFANLPMVARNHPMSAPNILADALFTLGRQWARIDHGKLPIATLPTDRYLAQSVEGGR